jgi:hypothetical protein
VTWRLATGLVLAACVGIAVWVAARDWKRTSIDGTLRASAAIQQLFPGLNPALLGQVGPTSWLVRLSGRERTRCFVVDTQRVHRDAHGVHGLRPAPCR